MTLLSNVILRDTLANRPAAGTAGRLFYDTTNSILYRDNGSTWDSVEGAGGGMATDPLWDTKGDLAVATGADAASKLAVGSNNQILIADSAQTTGVKWGAVPAAGPIYDFTVTGAAQAAIDTFVDNGGLGVSAALPTTYSVLDLHFYARCDVANASATTDIIVNNDTSSLYDHEFLRDINGTVLGSHASSAAAWQILLAGASDTASVFSSWHFVFHNYAGTVAFKAGVATGGHTDASVSSGNLVYTSSLIYRSTSAINRFKFNPNDGTKKLQVGSRLTIYAR